MSQIVGFIFDREVWTPVEAKLYIRKNFRAESEQIQGKSYLRFRNASAEPYCEDNHQIIDISSTVSIVVSQKK